MTLSELQSWLKQRKYAEVRPAETVARTLLPDGRRLRGLRITERLYLGRDLTFYHTIIGMAEPLALRDVLTRTSILVLDARWGAARRRAGVAKARRSRRIVARRS